MLWPRNLSNGITWPRNLSNGNTWPRNLFNGITKRVKLKLLRQWHILTIGLLVLQDSYIIDNGAAGIWAWIGKNSTKKEKSEAMRNALVRGCLVLLCFTLLLVLWDHGLYVVFVSK